MPELEVLQEGLQQVTPAPELVGIAKGTLMTFYYGLFAAVAIIVVLLVVMVLYYSWLKPVWPYLKSRNRPDRPLLMLFQKNGRVTWIPGQYRAEIYEKDDIENPLAFFKSDLQGYKLGQADLEVFYDGANVAVSPELAVAVYELKRMGYRNVDEVVDAVRAGTLRENDLVIPLVRRFDPAVVADWVRGKPAILKAWADTKVNIDRARRDQPFYQNPQVMAFAFLIFVACLGVGLMKALGVF